MSRAGGRAYYGGLTDKTVHPRGHRLAAREEEGAVALAIEYDVTRRASSSLSP